MATSSAVMIADTIQKDVVYSVECFDEKPVDSNTQLIVEYSVLALEAKYMPPGDQHDTIRTIDGVIDIINGASAIGALAFPPAAPVFAAIAAVGGGIQWLMSFIPDDRPNEVLEKYKDLKNAIEELEKKMDENFADMKSFITEHKFNVNIITQASTLMNFTKNSMSKKATKTDVDNFMREYLKNPPLYAIYYMRSFLDNRSTNPLIMAMDAEKTNIKATFNKWKRNFLGILWQYAFIEAFASGLLGRSEYNRGKICNQWIEIKGMIDEWEDEYRDDEKCWKDIKDGFVEFVEKHEKLDNAHKAEEIKKWVDRYLTRDAFYICVFDESKDFAFPSYQLYDSYPMAVAWQKGGCNAFVYRSQTTHKLTDKDCENLEKQFEKCCFALRWRESLKKMIEDQLVNSFTLPIFAFYAFIGDSCHPEILYVNDVGPKGLKKGPGSYGLMRLKDDSGHGKGLYWLIVGYY